jgi:hypothetical protein
MDHFNAALLYTTENPLNSSYSLNRRPPCKPIPNPNRRFDLLCPNGHFVNVSDCLQYG